MSKKKISDDQSNRSLIEDQQKKPDQMPPISVNPVYFQMGDRDKRIALSQLLIFISNQLATLEGVQIQLVSENKN